MQRYALAGQGHAALVAAGLSVECVRARARPGLLPPFRRRCLRYGSWFRRFVLSPAPGGVAFAYSGTHHHRRRSSRVTTTTTTTTRVHHCRSSAVTTTSMTTRVASLLAAPLFRAHAHRLRYFIGSPSSFAYFDERRPVLAETTAGAYCDADEIANAKYSFADPADTYDDDFNSGQVSASSRAPPLAALFFRAPTQRVIAVGGEGRWSHRRASAATRALM